MCRGLAPCVQTRAPGATRPPPPPPEGSAGRSPAATLNSRWRPRHTQNRPPQPGASSLSAPARTPPAPPTRQRPGNSRARSLPGERVFLSPSSYLSALWSKRKRHPAGGLLRIPVLRRLVTNRSCFRENELPFLTASWHFLSSPYLKRTLHYLVFHLFKNNDTNVGSCKSNNEMKKRVKEKKRFFFLN